MRGQYRKLPVVIEARQFETNNDDHDANLASLVTWINGHTGKETARHDRTYLYIDTLEGTHRADVGDWIIRGVKGEFYPCKPDIFASTYQRVDESNRITEGDIAAAIVGEYYFTGQDGVAGVQALAAVGSFKVDEQTAIMPTFPAVLVRAHPRLRDVTFCVLILRNAFVVVGKSCPVAPENFDAELGRKYARADAVNQCWPLMGYALRDRLHAEVARVPIYPAVVAPIASPGCDVEVLRQHVAMERAAKDYADRVEGHVDLENGDDRSGVLAPQVDG